MPNRLNRIFSLPYYSRLNPESHSRQNLTNSFLTPRKKGKTLYECYKLRISDVKSITCRFRKAAYTLAEVFITVAIIGVVAALTIPNLIQNHNEKTWSTAQSVFEKKLEVAAKQMNTEEKLAGYSTTKDFVNELKKYIKINKVCDSNEITKCFSKEVIWTQGEDPVDMTTVTSAKNLGQEDWDTEVIGVQFANGINAVIAYNPNATQDPYNNQFGATSNSMAILYDISGNKNPNTNGKDIGNINVKSLGGVTGCMVSPSLVGGMCITQILSPNSGYMPLNRSECEEIADAKMGNKKEWCGGWSQDYWAGAVKACGGTSKMPSQSQLTALAQYLYNGANIDPNYYTYNISLDTEKASPFFSAELNSDSFFVWSREESSSTGAYRRHFYSDSTKWFNGSRASTGIIAVCLGD